MQSSVKLIIRKGKLGKDGNHVVFIQYCYTSVKRVLISTDISIPAAYWDKDNSSIMLSLPSEHGSPESIQSILVIPRKGAQDSTAKEHKIPWERSTSGPFQYRRKPFRRIKTETMDSRQLSVL